VNSYSLGVKIDQTQNSRKTALVSRERTLRILDVLHARSLAAALLFGTFRHDWEGFGISRQV